MSARDPSYRGQAKRVARWVGFAMGLALVGGAVVSVVRNAPAVEHLRSAVGNPDWTVAGVAIAAAVANIAASGGLFFALVRRHGRIALFEMQQLIAVSALLNFAPLRPGLVGRVAYQRIVCGITVRRSALAIGEAAGVCVATICWLFLCAITAAWWDQRTLGAVMAGAPLLGGLVMMMSSDPWWRSYAEAVFWRWLDLVAWAVRYWCVFHLVGVDLPPESAAIAACVGGVANLVPFVGNGLGVREWAIGLAGPALAVWPEDLGLAADLVNRGIDLVTVVPIGLMAIPACTLRLRAALAAAVPVARSK